MRGQDLNLRPLGYEHYDARLSCSTATPESDQRCANALPTSLGSDWVSPVRARLVASRAQIRAQDRLLT